MKRTPLPRSTTPLARSPLPQRRKPLRSVSAKRRKLAPARKRCREAVIERAQGRCEVCGRVGFEVHEKLTRARGGSITDPSNCMLLCGECHAATHAMPREAAAIGLLISQHSERGRA